MNNAQLIVFSILTMVLGYIFGRLWHDGDKTHKRNDDD